LQKNNETLKDFQNQVKNNKIYAQTLNNKEISENLNGNYNKTSDQVDQSF
jgi:hypothetical protein